MRITGGLLAAVVVCALHATASAQGYTPPPPGGGGGPPAPGVTSQYRWDAGLIIALPQGDVADAASTSFGIRAAIGYNVNPNLSAHASFRYILVSSDIDGVDLSYYDLGLGGRYTMGGSGNIVPYGEAELVYSTFGASAEGFSDSDSDPGVLGRAGGIYKWKPNMDIIFFGSYTIIFVDEGDASWLELGGAVQGYF